MADIFNTLLVYPIINALVLIYKILFFVGIPYALGFSIIALTVLIRLLTYPLTNTQLRSMQKMQQLKPHMDKIQHQYKNDKARRQQETLNLYRQHGVNPAAGCLPVLVQLPIFIALYNVFFRIVGSDAAAVVEGINKILYTKALHLQNNWETGFFGIQLAATPAAAWQQAPVLVLVPVITAILQFVQSKMMSPKNEKTQNTEVQKDDFQKAMQTQMIYLFPLMIGFFSFTFPIGLSLYWNTYTVFGIIQQYLISKKQHG